MNVEVHNNAEAVAQAAADVIEQEVASRASTIGLAGGSTPRAAYRLLPARQLDWSHTTLWLADERWAPPDDPASNAYMAKHAFVDEVGAKLLMLDVAGEDPDEAAATYTAAVSAALAPRGTPELVMLGIGDDGHTASLFPDTAALTAQGRRMVANWVPQKDTWRVTATFDLLESAREVMFLVTGASKARVLAEILNGVPYPAQRVAELAASATWHVDREAASLLP